MSRNAPALAAPTPVVAKWRQGFTGAAKADATAVATEVLALSDRLDGVTPDQVVEAARRSTSAMHDLFEWSNAEAARQFRLVQARNLLNHLVVEVIVDQRPVDTRLVHVVVAPRDDNEQARRYRPAGQVFNDANLSDQVIANVTARLRGCSRDLRLYRAMEADAIDEVIRRLTE